MVMGPPEGTYHHPSATVRRPKRRSGATNLLDESADAGRGTRDAKAEGRGELYRGRDQAEKRRELVAEEEQRYHAYDGHEKQDEPVLHEPLPLLACPRPPADERLSRRPEPSRIRGH